MKVHLQLRPWQQSPDNNARGVVIWPEPEVMDITVTLYKVRGCQTELVSNWWKPLLHLTKYTSNYCSPSILVTTGHHVYHCI